MKKIKKTPSGDGIFFIVVAFFYLFFSLAYWITQTGHVSYGLFGEIISQSLFFPLWWSVHGVFGPNAFSFGYWISPLYFLIVSYLSFYLSKKVEQKPTPFHNMKWFFLVWLSLSVLLFLLQEGVFYLLYKLGI